MQLSRRPGFGMTIDIINGGEECKGQDPAAKKNREDRIGFYRHFASLLKVSVEKDCDCTGMGTY
jgi:hypothetical protein